MYSLYKRIFKLFCCLKSSDNCVVTRVIKRLPMISSNLARNISYLDYKYDKEKYLSDFKRTHVLSCSMFSKMLFSKYTEENTVDINRDVLLELISVRDGLLESHLTHQKTCLLIEDLCVN